MTLQEKQEVSEKEGAVPWKNNGIWLTCRLRAVWMAAHFLKRLRRNEIRSFNIVDSTMEIMHLERATSLKTFSGLLIGLVNLYCKQVDLFLQECYVLFRHLVKEISSLRETTNVPTNHSKRVVRHTCKKSWRIQRKKHKTALDFASDQCPSEQINNLPGALFREISDRGLEDLFVNNLNQLVCVDNTENVKGLSDLLQETKNIFLHQQKENVYDHEENNISTQNRNLTLEPLKSNTLSSYFVSSPIDPSERDAQYNSLQAIQELSLEELGVVCTSNKETIFHSTPVHKFNVTPHICKNLCSNESLDMATYQPYGYENQTSPSEFSKHNNILTPRSIDMQTTTPLTLSSTEKNFQSFSQKQTEFRSLSPHTLQCTDTHLKRSTTCVKNSFEHRQQATTFLTEDSDELTIVLSLSESTQMSDSNEEVQARPVIHRHRKAQSSTGFHLDQFTQFDENIFQEWTKSISPLLRPTGLFGRKDNIRNSFLHRSNIPIMPIRFQRAFFGTAYPLSFMKTRKPIILTERSQKDSNSLLPTHLSYPESHFEKTQSFASFRNFDTLEDFPSPFHPKEFLLPSVEGVPNQHRVNKAEMCTSATSNDFSAANLYRVLYDKDNEINIQNLPYESINRTPLKTPLNKLFTLNKSATPKSTFSGHSTFIESTVNEEVSDTSDNPSFCSLASQFQSPRTPTQGLSGSQEGSELNVLRPHYSIPCVFETPLQPPGVVLHSQSVQTLYPVKQSAPVIFCFSSAPATVQKKLCQEIGFSKRTIRLLEYLSYHLAHQNIHPVAQKYNIPPGFLPFKELVRNQSPSTVAATFFEILTLKSRLFIKFKQIPRNEHDTLFSHENDMSNILISFDARYYEFSPPYAACDTT